MSLIERNSEAWDDGGVDNSSTPKPPVMSALSKSLRKLSMSITSLGSRRSSSRLNGSTVGADTSVNNNSNNNNKSAHGPSSLADLLSTPATALLRAQSSILTLDPDTTVGDALAALASRRVLSAPVRTLEAAAALKEKKNGGGEKPDPPRGTTKEFAEASARATAQGRDFVCFVDVRDVLMSFLEVIPKGKLEGAKLLTRAKVLEEAGSKLESMPLSSLPVIGSDGAFVFEKRDEEEEEEGGEGEKAASASASGPVPLSADSMTLGSLLRDFLVCPPSSSSSSAASAAAAAAAAASTPAGGVVGVSVVRQGEFPRAKSVAHRVALLSPRRRRGGRGRGGEDAQQRVSHIVSQLDAARFVLQHASALGPLALKTAAELGWAGGKVVTVGPTAPAIEALAAMRRAGVSGLAVVEGGPSSSSTTTSATATATASSSSSPASNNSGAMIGSFAVPDLRALVCEHLGSLALPVGEALAKAKGREFWGIRGNNNSGSATPVGSFPSSSSASASASASASSAVAVPSPFASSSSSGPAPLSSSLNSAQAVLGTSPRDASAAAAAARRASIGGRVGQALATASPSDTFSAVLARLVARRVHRLHVVGDDDEAARPLGVVTLTDALAAVLEAAEASEREQNEKKKKDKEKEDAAKAALAS